MHEIELAIRNGAESWCACTCGWASEKTSEDDVTTAWAAHVATSALTTSTGPARA